MNGDSDVTRKNTFGDDDKHTPGVNDGLPSNPAAIIAYERKRSESRRLQTQALEMRKAGHTYREIGEVQGCSAPTAAHRVTRAIKREVPKELIDSVRAIELDRIDTITKMNIALMESAYRAGNHDLFFKAQNAVNAQHDRRKSIVPIQQPTKLIIDQQVTNQSEQDRELSELIGKEAEQMQSKLDSIQQMRQKAYG